jgi:hypothetical protein
MRIRRKAWMAIATATVSAAAAPVISIHRWDAVDDLHLVDQRGQIASDGLSVGLSPRGWPTAATVRQTHGGNTPQCRPGIVESSHDSQPIVEAAGAGGAAQAFGQVR